MDMLFNAVGQPARLNAIVKTQFPEVSVEMGPAIRNETPDAVMLMGTLENGALFQVHIEGGKLNRKGLQIEITGTEGNLEVSNERAFATKYHDIINGAQGEGDRWRQIEIQDQFHTIPPTDLDVSVQDLAQLYAAFAKDRQLGTNSTRDFKDAVRMHRLIDAITVSSSSSQTVTLATVRNGAGK